MFGHAGTHAQIHAHTHANVHKHTKRSTAQNRDYYLEDYIYFLTCEACLNVLSLLKLRCLILLKRTKQVRGASEGGARSWWRRCEELVTEMRLLSTFRPLCSSDSHLCSNFDKCRSNLFNNRHKCWALNYSPPVSLAAVEKRWYSGGWLTWIHWSI